MTAPVIGITCYLEAVDRDPWRGQRSVVLPERYAAHVDAAGAVPLIVPPVPDADEAWAATVLRRVDALVLAGGADLAADHYGEQPDSHAQEPRHDRDSSELALARVSERLDLPVLGICRGMQVLVVEAGGTLVQHLPDVVDSDLHLPVAGEWHEHAIRTVPGTRIADLLGDTFSAPTYHHQAVATAPGFTVSAHAPDGTVEAVEHPTARWRIGVQWHPEEAADPRLFEALVSKAQVRPADRRSASSI
ncbi:gamma-glutamyl-gamma-aminobutyrate hydrolase family protein [Luteipulveratus mongoliensis]|uniref:Uncharacterized protein n=1 Tax=Luteipulveratus mongoliensis TaxID=571913 RepID=A0A0K1JK64_9MICO|nr:gamma-glutamyl-gamma-aminobutyrate hydrolase family protein [Luteipulveratus mongoliensis]AKU16965.1 hypothetical protein VV02_15695 [Luteipulveratus mongoliensis]